MQRGSTVKKPIVSVFLKHTLLSEVKVCFLWHRNRGIEETEIKYREKENNQRSDIKSSHRFSLSLEFL